MGKPGSRRDIYLICIVLIAITIGIYWQVAGFGLLRLDDDGYVQNNPLVNNGLVPQSVIAALVAPYIDNYIPLVWISYMVDHDIGSELFNSDSPGVYHVTNVVLHTANAILLFLLLLKLTDFRWRSAFVAALFAVHPLHVESVAWVAERKDVLSTLFWLLATLAYVRYVERPDKRRWALVIVLFILGLMSKPMLVTLPLTLLLLDYWPLRRIGPKEGAGLREMVIEKIPLFALSLAACAITVMSQQHVGAVSDLAAVPLGARVANALVAFWTYIARMVWPAKLCCMYPHPGGTLPVWQTVGSAVLLVAATAAAIKSARKRPYLCVGWLWYLITLAPVIGIVQVGWQATADRYTYVPLIGIFVIIAWGVPDLLSRGKGEVGVRTGRALGLASAAIIAVLMPLTCRQIGTWRDDITLFKHAISIGCASPFTHNNLGAAYAAQGDDEAAVRHYAAAVRMMPDYTKARVNLAGRLAGLGRVDEAMKQLRKALETDPNCVPAREWLGTLLVERGRFDEAISHFKAALRIDPNNQNIQARLDAAEAQRP